MVYNSKLSVIETQKAIKLIKVKFEEELCNKLNLTRVSAPLIVEDDSGINDFLEEYKPFPFKTKFGTSVSIVQSLAKWKRLALKKYGFEIDTGLCTDMNAIRPKETVGPMHSIYVDQWDWEKVIKDEDRNMAYLQSVVKDIYACLQATERCVVEMYPVLRKKLPEQITFLSSQQMEDEFPQLSPPEREREYTRKYGAIFITQVGKILKSGKSHGDRAPDYDDWELNGDIVVHDEELDVAFELSSMGVRVTKETLIAQLAQHNILDSLNLPFRKTLASGDLPLTIGGGIGQSRLCMYFLEKLHIGEVQASVWDKDTLDDCAERNIKLL